MTTVLSDTGIHDVEATADGEDLWLERARLLDLTGWDLKPEGLCRDDACVPLPTTGQDAVRAGEVNVTGLWRLLNRIVLHDEARAVWLLDDGAAERAAALTSLDAPDFTLPDKDGRLHSLSDYRGKKVLIATWASW